MVLISRRVQQGECTKHFICIYSSKQVKIEEPYSWISASVNSVLCLRSSRTSGFNLLFCLPIYVFLKLKKMIVIIGDFFVSLPKQNNLSAAIWSALSRETVKCSFSDLNFDAFSVSQDPELCIRWTSNYCAEWIKLRLTQHPYYLKFI